MNDLQTAIEDAGIYYIHFNKMNVGSRTNGSLNFEHLKENVRSQLQGQYKEYFRANVDKKSLEVFDKAIGLNENEFLSQLNNALVKNLQQNLAVSKLQRLHNIVNGGNIDITNNLQAAINNRNSTEGVQALNSVLEIINKALNLLQSGNDSLGAILLIAVNGGTFNGIELPAANSLSTVGINLGTLLEEYSINNNFRLVRRQALQGAKNQLSNLASALTTGAFKSGNQLTPKGLSTLLFNGIVSTQIAEGLAFIMGGKAGSVLHNAVIQAVGTQNVSVIDEFEDECKITGKTDIQANHVKFSIDTLDTGDGGILDFKLGISSKFYKGQKFNDLQKTSFSGTYGSGSGGTLKEALSNIFNGSSQRYLAYNYITHDMYVEQMNDLIATRQLIRLFASAGSASDFAQFMIVNGQVVSIWSLIEYALSNNLGLSRSMDGAKSQAIVLSIPDRPKIAAANKYDILDKPGETPIIASWNRSRKVNAAIDSARIKAELHLNKLFNAI